MVENVDKSFRPLDGRTVERVRQIFYWNKNQLKFFREFRKKRFEAKASKQRGLQKELEYIGAQYQRVVRGMNRYLGFVSGKVFLTHGREDWKRTRMEN